MATYKAIRYNTPLTNGGEVFISEQTASSSANITFTTGLDDTFKKYIFRFINIHPAPNDAHFLVNFRDGSTAYDATKNTTLFQAGNAESGGGSEGVSFNAPGSLGNSTDEHFIDRFLANSNDMGLSGELHLYEPSSTTFIKHFLGRTMKFSDNPSAEDAHGAGYCNVTAAIDGVQFSMSSGNIDAGTIKFYGVK